MGQRGMRECAGEWKHGTESVWEKVLGCMKTGGRV